MNIPKIIVAKMFNVTRSAVTQSCKTRTAEEDFQHRMGRFIFSNRQSKVTMYIKKRYEELLKVAVLINQEYQDTKREVAGRPKTSLKANILRQIIRKFYIKMCEILALPLDTHETSDYTRDLIRFTVGDYDQAEVLSLLRT